MEDKKVSCSVCAWRATCKKRFLQGDSVALHCPDFTFDLTLSKKKVNGIEDENTRNKQGNTI